MLGTLTLRACEAIDAIRDHCEYQKSFPAHAIPVRGKLRSRGIAQENVGPRQQIEFLGCARLHANRGPGDVALWWKHAVPRTRRSGRHAIHPGLRNRTAFAWLAMEFAGSGSKSGNTHPRHALSLG